MLLSCRTMYSPHRTCSPRRTGKFVWNVPSVYSSKDTNKTGRELLLLRYQCEQSSGARVAAFSRQQPTQWLGLKSPESVTAAAEFASKKARKKESTRSRKIHKKKRRRTQFLPPSAPIANLHWKKLFSYLEAKYLIHTIWLAVPHLEKKIKKLTNIH